MSKQIIICNSIFTSDKGAVQAVACRLRGDANGKTLKVSPHLFKGNLPLPGEAIYAEYDEASVRESGNYRILSNAKILSVGAAPAEGSEAAEVAEEGSEDITTPF